MVAGELGYENPGEYRFLNRGISGNRSVDLYARIKSDIICLKPDVMSILIGVNDVWHELDSGNGVDGDKYFMIYSLLLKEIKEALPLTKIMILEPFVPGYRKHCKRTRFFTFEFTSNIFVKVRLKLL